MNEEELKKLKELLEQMKRMGEFQTVNSKKAKAEASSSTPSTKGKTVQPTVVSAVQQTGSAQQAKQQPKAQQAIKSPQTQFQGKHPMEQKRTFATAMVRDWYNKELLENDPEFYEKINGCHRAVQSADLRSANYWLTQIEKQYICIKQANIRKAKKEKESRDLVEKIIEYSSTSRSHALDLRDAQLLSNGSTEHKAIREVFSQMPTADLLNLRIQDVLELTKFFEIKNKKTLEYEAEITVQNMISLYQQQLIDEDSLLQFFKKMEETDISSLFENEEVILNEGKRPRLMVCFQEIQKYKTHIRKGIVSEIYINTNHPEEYVNCIPDICQEKVKEYASRFQTMFLFKVWSIWEERQYIKLYPSVQLWALYRVTSNPEHQFLKFQKKDFLEEKERRLAAKEFFEKAQSISSYRCYGIYEGKTILFLDTLQFTPDTPQQNSVQAWIDSLQLGRIGSMAKEEYEEEEELRIAQANEDDNDDNEMDAEMLAGLDIGAAE